MIDYVVTCIRSSLSPEEFCRNCRPLYDGLVVERKYDIKAAISAKEKGFSLIPS